MSGTDRSISPPAVPEPFAPAIVLVEPQMGANIGTAARAMANFALMDLRLVSPRDGWPNPKALAAASGANDVVGAARVFTDLREATKDCGRIYATSARPRELLTPIVSPEQAAGEIHALEARGAKCAILFGCERAGLTNDQISFADAIVSVPVNPGFASLNLAQAVLLMGYEWYKQKAAPRAVELPSDEWRPATREEVHHLFEHLEQELDENGFLFPPDKRPHMIRNIRTMFLRAQLTDQDVRIWRGIIKAMANGPKRKA